MKTTRQKIVEAAEIFLKEQNATKDNPKKLGEIVDYIQRLISDEKLDVTVNAGTIGIYISNAANHDEASKIVSGALAYSGYWYEDEESREATYKEPTEELARQPQKRNESELYPLIRYWLETKGYSAFDVSSKRARGKWSNPDLLGIVRTELMGAVELEMVSCEVKYNVDQWEQFIFEAISHKRFCDRSWYCYGVDSDTEQVPAQIVFYAEKYRVGVVQIKWPGHAVTEDQLDKYIECVREIIPAPFGPTSLKQKVALIDGSGIHLKPATGTGR